MHLRSRNERRGSLYLQIMWDLFCRQVGLQGFRFWRNIQSRTVSGALSLPLKAHFLIQAPGNRFGEGIYSYRNPAIVDQLYATSCTTSPFRVMIACDTSVDSGHCNSDEVRQSLPCSYPTLSDPIRPRTNLSSFHQRKASSLFIF